VDKSESVMKEKKTDGTENEIRNSSTSNNKTSNVGREK